MTLHACIQNAMSTAQMVLAVVLDGVFMSVICSDVIVCKMARLQPARALP